jgi:hypothetical protein
MEENTENTETKDPSELGKLTPEEQQTLTRLKQDTAQYLNKIGEFEVMKARLMNKLEAMEQEGQGVMEAISKRLGLEPGKQWVAMLDGTIRLVSPPGEGQTQGEAAPPTA